MAMMRATVVLLAIMAMAGCAGQRPYRGDPYANRDLDAFLAFLQEPVVSRSTVEARLGPPQATFEGGHVAAYRLWEGYQETPGGGWDPMRKERKLVFETECRQPWGIGCERSMIQLMIEYDAGSRVRRHNVIRTH